MVKSVPAFVALIPMPVSPVTAPVDLIPSTPVPELVAFMPLWPPVTFTASMVRCVPDDAA